LRACFGLQIPLKAEEQGFIHLRRMGGMTPMHTRGKIEVLGGAPLFERPLNIVRPSFPAVDTFLPSFRAALAAGQVTNNGRWVLEFEQRLSEYLGVPTLAFCNGQLALMTMLRAAGIEKGEVIVPSFTFPATPHAVRWCGAEPVFADIGPGGSMCLDPRDVERRITSKTVAILGVDSYGIACDYANLTELGRRRDLKVLFDSAAAFGTRLGEGPVGGYGDAQIFSFHATKAFPTMEGGCLCSHDEQLVARAKAIRNFGQDANGDCAEAGLNGKLTEICALIGLEQLKGFDHLAEGRRHAVQKMAAGLRQIPGLTLAQVPDNQEPIWLYLPVIIDKDRFGLDRDEVAAIFEKENLFVRKYFSPPCHHLSAYRAKGEFSLLHTEAIAYNVIALPVYSDMTDFECEGIVQLFRETHHAAAQIRARLRERAATTKE
jgi:dTDP-4-amino-4,6-dideoxyglucose